MRVYDNIKTTILTLLRNKAEDESKKQGFKRLNQEIDDVYHDIYDTIIWLIQHDTITEDQAIHVAVNVYNTDYNTLLGREEEESYAEH